MPLPTPEELAQITPTLSLPPEEVERLSQLIRKARAKGAPGITVTPADLLMGMHYTQWVGQVLLYASMSGLEVRWQGREPVLSWPDVPLPSGMVLLQRENARLRMVLGDLLATLAEIRGELPPVPE